MKPQNMSLAKFTEVMNQHSKYHVPEVDARWFFQFLERGKSVTLPDGTIVKPNEKRTKFMIFTE